MNKYKYYLFDHDGTITVKDATTIQKFVVDLISNF